jgi:hypothetical protein
LPKPTPTSLSIFVVALLKSLFQFFLSKQKFENAGRECLAVLLNGHVKQLQEDVNFRDPKTSAGKSTLCP